LVERTHLRIRKIGKRQARLERRHLTWPIIKEGVHKHVHIIVLVYLINWILIKRGEGLEVIELVHL
jgi:hypothetical protein